MQYGRVLRQVAVINKKLKFKLASALILPVLGITVYLSCS